MTVRIGFTGTRVGMTQAQQTSVTLLLLELGATDVHHGDCVGADDQFDQIGRELGLTIWLHPPVDPSKRAWCNMRPGESRTEIRGEPYLKRNKAIVDQTIELIAAPKEMAETLRAGTWSTVRYARKPGWTVLVVWPDGSQTVDWA